MKDSKLKTFLKGEYSALAVFVAMVIPVMIHTKTLLLSITNVSANGFELELYAWFFAAAFDCSIFMFAVDGNKKAAGVFAFMSFIVGFMFWNMDILFIEFWADGANAGELWARFTIGTLWSAFAAYLLYYTAETFAKRLNEKKEAAPLEATRVKPSARRSAPRTKAVPAWNEEINGHRGNGHRGNASKLEAAQEGRPTKAKAKRTQKIKRVKELTAQGLSAGEIAEQTGFGRTMVYEYQKS